MSDKTTIEWTDATWNPVRGCSRVSEGCRHCYAESQAARFTKPGQAYEGLAHRVGGEARWTGEIKLVDDALLQPLRWKKPRRIFVNSMSDLFHEKVPDAWIDKVFAVIALCPQHTFQVLTKRPERMSAYLNGIKSNGRAEVRLDILLNVCRIKKIDPPAFEAFPLPNVWLGVSVENQATADERIPLLLQTPAALRFLSCEPLLGPLDISGWLWGREKTCAECPQDADCECGWNTRKQNGETSLDWVICGGESGHSARPMHPDWARGLRDQCTAASVPFFFKQWGAWEVIYDRDKEDPDWRRCDLIMRKNPRGRWVNLTGGHGFHGERVVWANPVRKKKSGRVLDGCTHHEFPQPR